MQAFARKDHFDENEKKIIKNLIETEELKAKTSYCDFDDVEYYKKWSRSQHKMANFFITIGLGCFLFFILLYFTEGANVETKTFYVVLFILCVVIIVFWIAVKGLYIKKIESVIYEKKKVVCKFYIGTNAKGVQWMNYSVAEVLSDGQVQYFGTSVQLTSDDDKIYENKLLLADMTREKDQAIKMFHVDLTNCTIIRTKDYLN